MPVVIVKKQNRCCDTLIVAALQLLADFLCIYLKTINYPNFSCKSVVGLCRPPKESRC